MFKPLLTDTAEKLSQKACALLGENNTALAVLFYELLKIRHELFDQTFYIYDQDNKATGVAIPIEIGTKHDIKDPEKYITEIKQNPEKAKTHLKEITPRFSEPDKKAYYFAKKENLYYYNNNGNKPQLYRVFTLSQIEELQKQKEQKKLEQQSELYQKMTNTLHPRFF